MDTPPRPEIALFERAHEALSSIMQGPWRLELIDTLASEPTLGQALARLHTAMATHRWPHPGCPIDLSRLVNELDRTTRRVDGLHVLHDWDGKAARVTANSIAVDVADFVASARGHDRTDRTTIAVALDFYFLYLLAVLAVRAWDNGEPGANLDRVTDLLKTLQGPHGSGQRFADDAETLLLIATSHYEPNETGYATLLARARALPAANRTRMALTHAQAMGSHLRFGYEITYAEDIGAMRADNGADYPWLGFGLASLIDEYARLRETGESGDARMRVVEGIINGLTADPEAFLVRRPSSMSAHTADYEAFAARFDRVAPDLLAEFDRHRPSDTGYSPLAIFFNFSINVLKGLVVHALINGQASAIGLNDMFTGVSLPETNDTKARLARTLMGYARAKPDEIGGRMAPVIVYDPVIGRRAFGAAVRVAKHRATAAAGPP
jgi:hypothetical protein